MQQPMNVTESMTSTPSHDPFVDDEKGQPRLHGHSVRHLVDVARHLQQDCGGEGWAVGAMLYDALGIPVPAEVHAAERADSD
jgi:hypothetical protein